MAIVQYILIVAIMKFFYRAGAALFLAPSWLVTTRYFIVPIVLYLLYRKPERPKIELATLATMMAGSTAYFFFGFTL